MNGQQAGLLKYEYRQSNQAGFGSSNVYAYDSLGQLTQSIYEKPTRTTMTYNYDAGGNSPYPTESEAKNVGTGNRLLADASSWYSYDGEGNLIAIYERKANENRTAVSSDANPRWKWEFTYDHANRLLSATWGDSRGGANASFTPVDRVDYTYDAEGQLVQRTETWLENPRGAHRDEYGNDWKITVNQGPPLVTRNVQAGDVKVQRYLHDGDHVFADLNGSNQVQSHYVIGTKVDDLIARQDAGVVNPYWYLTDRQGSVLQIIDSVTGGSVKVLHHQGTKVDVRTQGVLGAALNFHDRYEYTGREMDHLTGLQFNRARWLHTASGRFMSEDTLGFAAGDTNLYRYVGNSSPNATDPSGHIINWLTGLIGAVVGGIVGGVSAALNGEDVVAGATKGAIIGGVAGLTFGAASFLANRAATVIGSRVFGLATTTVGTGTRAATILTSTTARVATSLASTSVGGLVADAAAQGSEHLWDRGFGFIDENQSFHYDGKRGLMAAIAAPLSQVVGRAFGMPISPISGTGVNCAQSWQGAIARNTLWGVGGATSGFTADAAMQIGDLWSGKQEGWNWQRSAIATGTGFAVGFGARAAMTKSCFAAGMKLMARGAWGCSYRKIEKITTADEVLSRPENQPNGPLQWKKVEELFQRTAPIFNLHANGQLIRTTQEHPFFVKNQNAWVSAGELLIGDVLVSHDGQEVIVEGIAPSGEWEAVYNLRVADWHTYFVGDVGWGWSVWAHNTYADFMKTVVDLGVDSKLSLGSRRFRAGSRNPNGVDGDLYALAHEHLASSEITPAFAQDLRQKFGNITNAQIEHAWSALKAEPTDVGATGATRAGTDSHKVFADADRASGLYDQVGTMIRTQTGDPILVPHEVNLQTGTPTAGKGTQRSFPDAVSFARRELVDYKPIGRLLSKDRQEMIRNITAYQMREGHLPDRIIIREYDPATMTVVNETVHAPSIFLPRPKGS